jgi:hypothetical protein
MTSIFDSKVEILFALGTISLSLILSINAIIEPRLPPDDLLAVLAACFAGALINAVIFINADPVVTKLVERLLLKTLPNLDAEVPPVDGNAGKTRRFAPAVIGAIMAESTRRPLPKNIVAVRLDRKGRVELIRADSGETILRPSRREIAHARQRQNDAISLRQFGAGALVKRQGRRPDDIILHPIVIATRIIAPLLPILSIAAIVILQRHNGEIIAEIGLATATATRFALIDAAIAGIPILCAVENVARRSPVAFLSIDGPSAHEKIQVVEAFQRKNEGR